LSKIVSLLFFFLTLIVFLLPLSFGTPFPPPFCFSYSLVPYGLAAPEGDQTPLQPPFVSVQVPLFSRNSLPFPFPPSSQSYPKPRCFWSKRPRRDFLVFTKFLDHGLFAKLPSFLLQLFFSTVFILQTPPHGAISGQDTLRRIPHPFHIPDFTDAFYPSPSPSLPLVFFDLFHRPQE